MSPPPDFTTIDTSANRLHRAQTPEILLDGEINVLLVEARKSSERDYMMIFLALNTGLRNSELLGLLIEDVRPYEIITPLLDVRPGIAKNSIARSIPLRQTVQDELVLFLKTDHFTSDPPAPNEPLFQSSRGVRPLCPRDFQRIVRTHALNSLGRCIHPHALRHTFATKLLAVSNIRIVQQLLGHKNLQSTQIYTHPSSNDMAEAVNKL